MALAACAATLDESGTFTLPLVTTPEGSFRYTLVPTDAVDLPPRYLATRQAADPASAGCAATAFTPRSTAVLQATGIARMGQTLSVSLQEVPGTQGTAFTKSSASVTGGMLDGYVGESTPLTGATVVVRNTTGSVVATGTTNEYGALIVMLDTLPDSFKVIVTGGTMSGQPFTGTLKAEMENYTTVEHDVSINVTPVTTLVAAYHERYPGLSLNEAMAHVKVLLGMPETMDIDADDQSTIEYFDSASFYAAAAAGGGVDAFVQTLLDLWATGEARNFAPAVAVDLQQPTLLMSELLPAVDLPNFKTACAGCQQPQEAAIAFTIVGKIYDLYQGDKTANWQADVISKLDRIILQMNAIKSSVANIAHLQGEQAYVGDRKTLDPWVNKLTEAFTDLEWLAKHPAKPQPPNCPAAENTTATQLCKEYLAWPGLVATKKARIQSVTNPSNETLTNPMATFRNALVGNGSTGMLRQFRTNLVEKLITPPEGGDSKFFVRQHSQHIWNHYRYWENIQAMAYFFYADRHEALGEGVGVVDVEGKPSAGQTLHDSYKGLLADEMLAMPIRVLENEEVVIDPKNTSWGGVSAGGPLIWLPRSVCSFFNFVFDRDNVSIQSNLKTFVDCLNSTSFYKGSTSWKLPTFKEWEAFTLTEQRPGRNIGEWITLRGMKEGTWFNGQHFFATERDSCPERADGRPFCFVYETRTTGGYVRGWRTGFTFNVWHAQAGLFETLPAESRAVMVRKMAEREYF
ncbi:MAG TPA: hypothetical protein VK996_02015 [Ramlibacter sp.]|nr:hypothetical protein [Ramlibacter sp.]